MGAPEVGRDGRGGVLARRRLASAAALLVLLLLAHRRHRLLAAVRREVARVLAAVAHALALGPLADRLRGDGLLLAAAPLDAHAPALHPGRQLLGGALGDLVEDLLHAVADADLVVVRRVEHEDVATFKFELVAVRARRPVDGAVALALVGEAARENGRVADGPQRYSLRVLVEVVLELALPFVGVDEELAVVEGFHLTKILPVFPGLEVDDAARVEHVAEQRHRPVVAERLQILDGLRALRAHQRVRVEDFGILVLELLILADARDARDARGHRSAPPAVLLDLGPEARHFLGHGVEDGAARVAERVLEEHGEAAVPVPVAVVAAARPVEDDDSLLSVSGARGTKGLGPLRVGDARRARAVLAAVEPVRAELLHFALALPLLLLLLAAVLRLALQSASFRLSRVERRAPRRRRRRRRRDLLARALVRADLSLHRVEAGRHGRRSI
mmetsp:Transcript_10827/g.31950  ORF Transcript_10827/g.31950 Transcript_10827/m.31950 type:complete len:446 (-) Transcript_10827:711-2048(-)